MVDETGGNCLKHGAYMGVDCLSCNPKPPQPLSEDGIGNHECQHCDLPIRETHMGRVRNEWEHLNGLSYCADGEHWAWPKAIKDGPAEGIATKPKVMSEIEIAREYGWREGFAAGMREPKAAEPASPVVRISENDILPVSRELLSSLKAAYEQLAFSNIDFQQWPMSQEIQTTISKAESMFGGSN